MFIHSVCEKIVQESDSNVFADNIKSFVNKYNDIDKQMKGRGFSFKFVSSLSSGCDKLNLPSVAQLVEI